MTRRIAFFCRWVVDAVDATAFVAAGWIAIIDGFAALAIREPGSPPTAAAGSASTGPAAA